MKIDPNIIEDARETFDQFGIDTSVVIVMGRKAYGSLLDSINQRGEAGKHQVTTFYGIPIIVSRDMIADEFSVLPKSVIDPALLAVFR